MARAAYGRPAGSPRSGRRIALTAAAVVLVIAAAAATLALAHHRSGSGSPPAGAGPSSAIRASTSAPAAAPSATPGTSLASGNSVVVAAGAAGSPHASAVVSFLARYFAAINAHDYQAYRRLFGAAIRGGLSQAAFTAGYGTTNDSAAKLRGIGVIGPAELDAVVTFTSHQLPGQSPSHSSCTAWRISLYLVREGNGYLLHAPPSGYRASFRACP